MGVPYIMTKTGQEAWDQLQAIQAKAVAEGRHHSGQSRSGADRPGNAGDGWIHLDPQYQTRPALQGYAGDHSLVIDRVDQRRSHVKSVGADAYIAQVRGRRIGRHHPRGAGQGRTPLVRHPATLESGRVVLPQNPKTP